jgi:hypothetical protein
LAAAVLVAGALWAADAPAALEGVWLVRSLSNPEVPMVITLSAGGAVSEEIGDFRGAGTWKAEGSGARIFWDSGWEGLLRPAAKGGYELLTWKKKTPRAQPPDDTQPAARQKASP